MDQLNLLNTLKQQIRSSNKPTSSKAVSTIIDLSKCKVNEKEGSLYIKSILSKCTSNYISNCDSYLNRKRKRERIQHNNLSIERKENFEISHTKECVICLFPVEKKYFFSCGHSFHKSCAMDWLKTKIVCPLCKQSMIHFVEVRKSLNNEILLLKNDLKNESCFYLTISIYLIVILLRYIEFGLYFSKLIF